MVAIDLPYHVYKLLLRFFVRYNTLNLNALRIHRNSNLIVLFTLEVLERFLLFSVKIRIEIQRCLKINLNPYRFYATPFKVLDFWI